MAFPANKQTLSEALTRVKNEAAALKSMSIRWRTQMSNGNVEVSSLFDMLDTLRQMDDFFSKTLLEHSGTDLGNYAAEQLGKNVATDFTNMRNAMTQAFTVIRDTIPKSSTNPLEYTFDSQGVKTPVVLSSSDTSAAQTALTDLIATIE